MVQPWSRQPPFAASDALLALCGRGKLLDNHERENGLRQRLAEGSSADLLQIAARNQSNPEIITIGFDVLTETPAAADGPGDTRLQAAITWGVGKGVSSAVIDLRVGAQVTICAATVNVQAIYPPRIDEGGGGAGAVFFVSANAVYGTRGTENAAGITFTGPVETVLVADPAVGAQQPVPKYAVSVAWFSPDDPDGAAPPAAALRFFGRAGAGATLIADTITTAGQFVAIPNGVYFVQVHNISAAGVSQQFRLVYELCL